MRLTADENIPLVLIRWLRGRGDDVVSVREMAPGAPDTEILQSAAAEGRIVVTTDKDFGELVFRRRIHAAGVVLIRASSSNPAEFLENVSSKWETIAGLAAGNFVLVEDSGIRVRRLPDLGLD